MGKTEGNFNADFMVLKLSISGYFLHTFRTMAWPLGKTVGWTQSPRRGQKSDREWNSLYMSSITKKNFLRRPPLIFCEVVEEHLGVSQKTRHIWENFVKRSKLTSCISLYNLCILWEKQRVISTQTLGYLSSVYLANFLHAPRSMAWPLGKTVGYTQSPRRGLKSDREWNSLYMSSITKKKFLRRPPLIFCEVVEERFGVSQKTRHVREKSGNGSKLTSRISLYNLCILWGKQRVISKRILWHLLSLHVAQFWHAYR